MVVAGGSGRRFGGPKQFLPLAGLPVAAWSVRAARSVADGVVLVVPPPDRGPDGPGTGSGPDRPGTGSGPDRPGSDRVPAPGATGEAALGADTVVTGGATRAASVRAGLAAVPAEAEVIVVHDAARPLARPELFASVVAAVRAGADGAVPAVPVADTLKRTEGDRVAGTVERDGLVSVQTPQAFAAAALRTAHGRSGEATDDAGLLEATGATVVTVAGDPGNLKVTRPEDLALAGVLLAGSRP